MIMGRKKKVVYRVNESVYLDHDFIIIDDIGEGLERRITIPKDSICKIITVSDAEGSYKLENSSHIQFWCLKQDIKKYGEIKSC